MRILTKENAKYTIQNLPIEENFRSKLMIGYCDTSLDNCFWFLDNFVRLMGPALLKPVTIIISKLNLFNERYLL